MSGTQSAPPTTDQPVLARIATMVVQLFRFAWLELQCCLFAILIFLALGVSGYAWSTWDIPFSRADALLAYVIVIQAVLIAAKIETWRELAVICAFHLLGLGLEVFKVHVGSWTYPDPGTFQIGQVPLYSGFMYAAVGSYLCQAFRRFDLRVIGFRIWPAAVLAIAAYANFFTQHFIGDFRVFIAVGFVVVLWGSWVHFTVGQVRYRMPLAVSFVLIGFFLWVAENAGTFLGAWRYPNQVNVWEMVHVGKLGSWALLVSLSFLLVAVVKAQEGRLYDDRPARVDRRSSSA